MASPNLLVPGSHGGLPNPGQKHKSTPLMRSAHAETDLPGLANLPFKSVLVFPNSAQWQSYICPRDRIVITVELGLLSRGGTCGVHMLQSSERRAS